MYNDYIKIINICVKCTTFLIKKRTSPPRTPSIPQSLRDLFRFPRQMRTAMGSHIPHASGRILAERFLFVRKVSTECTAFLTNKKTPVL